MKSRSAIPTKISIVIKFLLILILFIISVSGLRPGFTQVAHAATDLIQLI